MRFIGKLKAALANTAMSREESLALLQEMVGQGTSEAEDRLRSKLTERIESQVPSAAVVVPVVDGPHANEIQLVRIGATGTVIPTPNHAPIKKAAEALGPAHEEAFAVQVERQVVALRAAA